MDLHDEAWTVYCQLKRTSTWPCEQETTELYEARRSLPLKFKTIQLNAALLVGESTFYGRGSAVLPYASTPEAPSEASDSLHSDSDLS